jgi:hypothetical protein
MIPLLEPFIGADWESQAAEESGSLGSYKGRMSIQATARRPPEHLGWLFSLRLSSRLKIQILGLAAAVFLWGLGYKLSLYHHHPHPTTVSVAKLWVDPRGSSTQGGLPTAKRLRAIVDQASALQPLPPDPVPGLSFSRDSLIAVSVGGRQGSDRLLKVLRSPPPRLS